MTPSQAEFLVLAALSVFGAVGVVVFNNPIRAALSLVLNFFVLGFLYFFLGSQIMGITQIMVYAGAIMVLFLFVIMMLRLGDASNKVKWSETRVLLSFVFGVALFGSLFGTVMLPLSRVAPQMISREFGTPEAVGYTLFTGYVWPFEVISVLLLIGIVGSIMLAKRKF